LSRENSWIALKRPLQYVQAREKGWQFEARLLGWGHICGWQHMFRELNRLFLQNLCQAQAERSTAHELRLYPDIVLPAATWYEATAVLIRRGR
jgi:hypothetical protein